MQENRPTYTPNLTVASFWGMFMIALLALIALVLLLDIPADWRSEEGFLGTDAPLMSDLTVVAYVLLLLPLMLAGGVFALNKKFVPHHQVVMTLITILNWGLIAFTMWASFDFVSSNENVPDEFAYQVLPYLHAGLGVVAQILATILVIRMWFEEALPASLRFKVKNLMRLTLALWIMTALGGILMYNAWYLSGDDNPSTDNPSPIVTEEPGSGAENTAPIGTEESGSDDPADDPVSTAEPGG